MRLKIKLRPVSLSTRPRIVIRTPINSTLLQILRAHTSTKQVLMITCLLQRYGVVKVKDLPADRIQPFTETLQGVLAGKLPHPADSDLTPFYSRKENKT